MKKKLIMALCGCMVSAMILASCGGTMKDTASSAPGMPAEDAGYGNGFYGGGYYEEMDKGDFDYTISESENAMVTDLTYSENVKLIFRANLRLQTLNFAETESQLNQLVKDFGGYFENMSTDNGSYYYEESYKYGYYTVRVPADKYDAFLSAVGDGCHVVSVNKSTEDVGLAYADIETRLATLRTKMDRLQELLKKADKMEDIITLEGAISDCQYQIDSLQSQQNRYDSLIGFSTIDIEVEQVRDLNGSVVEERSFFEELGRNFTRGVRNFGYSLEELAYWIAYNIIGIAIAIAAVVCGCKLVKKGKIRKPELKNPLRKHKDNNDKDE